MNLQVVGVHNYSPSRKHLLMSITIIVITVKINVINVVIILSSGSRSDCSASRSDISKVMVHSTYVQTASSHAACKLVGHHKSEKSIVVVDCVGRLSASLTQQMSN